MTEEQPQEIPGMNLDNKYSAKPPIVSGASEEVQKEMDKTKKELDKLKNYIVKKYKFTLSLSILNPQSVNFFVEEEEVPKEAEKYIQLYWVIPEDQFKNIPKLKQEVVKQVEEVQKKLKEKIWLQIKTPVDIWEMCLDSKFELTSAVGMSFPLYDQGFLTSLRVAEIHKSMVLQKFEKYVVSYVIAGSFVRGDVVKASDVDVYVVINDTDVKRMPRVELLERLRSIIYNYIPEASALAGVKGNILNVQIYLLTDFWQSVKDAHPVIFTLIRDGVPLYDRGTFMPWKALLKMGKLKPSPEAIDMFMSMGDNTVKRAKRALMDILLNDIYWSVITPSQALLMLYGLPPPDIKNTYKDMKKVFVDKEKLLEMKYIKTLEEVTIKYYKGYEHEKIKEISGKEIDHLLKGTEAYLNRLKELRGQIEKIAQKRTVEQVHKDVFALLKTIIGNKAEAKITEEFETNYVKKGKFSPQDLRALKDLVSAKAESKKGKLTFLKADEARKTSVRLINHLIEYSQRCDLITTERGRMILKYGKGQVAELLSAGGKSFLIQGRLIKKLDKKAETSTMEEVSETLNNQKEQKNIKVDPHVFELVKKELGDFEIVF
jgi:predicted nucleotidyltransferase/uncharacterized protein (UPF0332 family)